jgi:hypothetical protein
MQNIFKVGKPVYIHIHSINSGRIETIDSVTDTHYIIGRDSFLTYNGGI